MKRILATFCIFAAFYAQTFAEECRVALPEWPDRLKINCDLPFAVRAADTPVTAASQTSAVPAAVPAIPIVVSFLNPKFGHLHFLIQ